MSKYERLIIYPLLFLALFSALTGVNIVNATQQVLERIVAREIVVVNDEGQEVAVLKYDEQKQNASFEMFNNDGRRVVSLLSYADGGAVGIFNQEGHLTAAIQNEANAGAFLLYNGTKDMTKLVALRSGLYGGVLRSITPGPAHRSGQQRGQQRLPRPVQRRAAGLFTPPNHAQRNAGRAHHRLSEIG